MPKFTLTLSCASTGDELSTARATSASSLTPAGRRCAQLVPGDHARRKRRSLQVLSRGDPRLDVGVAWSQPPQPPSAPPAPSEAGGGDISANELLTAIGLQVGLAVIIGLVVLIVGAFVAKLVATGLTP